MELYKLILDPKCLAHKMGMKLIQNEETNTMELEVVNDSKDCSNWPEWQAAFRVFMAIYLSAHPDRALELLQYEKMIQDIAHHFHWEAMVMYDQQFCHLISEFPILSWGEKNMELYLECFNRYTTLPPKVKKFQKPTEGKQVGATCNNYNKGTCAWGRACWYVHRCELCGKYGHPKNHCRGEGKKPSGKTIEKKSKEKK